MSPPPSVLATHQRPWDWRTATVRGKSGALDLIASAPFAMAEPHMVALHHAGSGGLAAGMHMMMMQMYFTASTHVTLWLKEWHTDTTLWYTLRY